MRIRIAILITSMMLAVSMLGGAHSAAAQAEHYDLAYCSNQLDGTVHCIEETSVVQAHETSPGIFVGVSNGTYTYTVTLDGEVIASGQTKSHFIHVDKGSQAHVDRWTVRTTYSYIDTNSGETITCTYHTVAVYANGETRHEKSLECS